MAAFNFFDIEEPTYTPAGTVFGAHAPDVSAATVAPSDTAPVARKPTVAEEMSSSVHKATVAPRGKPMITYVTGVVLHTSMPPSTDGNVTTNYTMWIAKKVRNGDTDGSVIRGTGQSIGDHVISFPVEEMDAKDRAAKARDRNAGGGPVAVKRNRVEGVFINLRVGTVLTFRVSRIIPIGHGQISSGSVITIGVSEFLRETYGGATRIQPSVRTIHIDENTVANFGPLDYLYLCASMKYAGTQNIRIRQLVYANASVAASAQVEEVSSDGKKKKKKFKAEDFTPDTQCMKVTGIIAYITPPIDRKLAEQMNPLLKRGEPSGCTSLVRLHSSVRSTTFRTSSTPTARPTSPSIASASPGSSSSTTCARIRRFASRFSRRSPTRTSRRTTRSRRSPLA